MPGLNQLKKFSTDVENLGDELNIRKNRGEKPVQVALPVNISEDDDSDDFVLGMPVAKQTENNSQETDNSSDSMDADFSQPVAQEDYSDFPELDSLLNPADDDLDLSDLSAFPDLEEVLNPPLAEADSETASIEDIFEKPSMNPRNDQEISELEPADSAEELLPIDEKFSSGFDSLPSLDDMPDLTAELGADFEPFGKNEKAQGSENAAFDSQDQVQDDFQLPEIPDFDNIDNLQLPDLEASDEDWKLPPEDALTPLDDLAATDAPFATADEDSSQIASDLPEIPDFDNIGNFQLPDFESPAFSADNAFTSDLPEPSAMPADTFNADSFATDAFSADSLDEIPGLSVDTAEDSDGNIDFDAFKVPEDSIDDPFSSAANHEIFEAPEDPFDGNPPVSDDDMDFDGDFDIPGFSDQVAGQAKARPTPKSGPQEKNTLTDTEYQLFRKNLSNYPLNLRIALQEFIVNDEFKDNIVFDVIQKVLKKTPARQLAQQLEKLLDVSIPVPRDFEKRTFEQYEEYKKSAEYQLKNRILPAAILCIMAGCIVFLLATFGINVIYKPLKAESLYKEGYTLLENKAYPQSELLFNQALEYQQKKKWFGRYAEGYRLHKQYERARIMFNAGLQRFNQDKALGLAYGQMELNDLRNFEEAERVVRREVLDYHINDKDGLLLLGDIFLEWGDEKDTAKYEEARLIYEDLQQLYGQQDLYLSRMLRYFIRVDDLRNVLQLKAYFFPKKKALGGEDLIELSGYLLDKQYKYIAPADEYLLSSIEDVRDLLERAVKAAPEIPESYYNMGLYFNYKNNTENAKTWLTAAKETFAQAPNMPRKRILKQINTERLLGEIFANEDEYLTAEEYFRTGIDIFENAQAAGLESTQEVGLLYASLADLNYFVSNDLDEALKNYLLSVENKNDTAGVRYRIGYIQYANKNYSEALGSFIKTAESKPTDSNLLLALGNVLSVRGDNFAAQGYYERLIQLLDSEKARHGIMFPQVNTEHSDIVDLYLKGANNLGVTLHRLARQTGNSALNAEALTNLTASLRAWDALTRNQETLVRLPGSNLAERNIAYMTFPIAEYEPAIYTEIPRVLSDEFIPE